MRYFLLPILLTFAISVNGQDFYDVETIQTIEITFAESNWDQLLDNAKATTEDYILAESVTINGIAFDSVGVKYKGNSTYNPNQTKNPFHIELDTYKDQDYDGYTDIKLSNVAKDPSFLREVLSYQIIRQYMHAPLSNYANVYVNGTLIGLYSNSEAVSKKFVDNRFDSKNNTFVKCNPPAGAGPGSNDFPNLVYMGADSTDYYDAYEIKSDFGWQELIDLCDTLANQTDAIEDILDVDRALWMLALNNVMVNLDSYIGGFKQNYYLYKDDNGRFNPVIWDLNESFGRFTMAGGGTNLNSTTAKQQMSHLLHATDSDFPLVQQLLSVPLYKRMYLAHYKTILLENFDNGIYSAFGESLQGIIDAAVQADNNKFFTYNNFVDNLDSDVNSGGGGPGGGATVGITNLMDGRNDYLLGLSDFSQTEPIISDIQYSTSSPVIGEGLTITAIVTDANAAYLGFRSDEYGIFQRVEMYDDGNHGDGAANDNVFGITIPIERDLTQYYIYAENDNIGKFSPQRAEHEYHKITATSGSNTPSELVINEFMASNDDTAADLNGEFDDWIELFNNSGSDIDLTGYSLTDNFDNLTKWTFPDGTIISGGNYLIIWADEDGSQEGLHANFKLSASGESIFLVDQSESIVDEIAYTDQSAAKSYGRFPNGTGSFQLMTPTFNAMNSGTSNTEDEAFVTGQLSIYPNPASNAITISANEPIERLSLYTATGVKVKEVIPTTSNISIDMTVVPEGMYIVIGIINGRTETSKVVIKR